METITLNFKASGQNLTADAHPQRYASNTVNYIQAVFDLDDNWKSFDSVRAVWHNDFACISTVLDGNGACTVPHEVLTNLDEVIVNLVGSNVEGEELVDRMTTYPLRVVIIDAHARICGTETAEVTPSQFEQFIAQVAELVGSVRDIDRIELNEDYTLTVYFSDETSWTSTSIRGEQGETGNGIASAVLNDDYTLTLNFTDDTSYTTSSIRGEQGPQGEPGEVTLAQLSAVLPTDTASGAIASFPDGSDLFDYLSCIVNIEPVQAGSGTPSPDNVRPITGWTGCEVINDPTYGGDIWWNQQFGGSNTRNVDYGGLHITVNQDYSVTLSGSYSTTDTFWCGKYIAPIGHKLMIWTDSSDFEIYFGYASTRGKAVLVTTTAETSYYGVYVVGGKTYNETSHICCCDLTAMLGAGNEPTTVNEFKAIFPNAYYPYNSGEKTNASAVNGTPYGKYNITWQTEAGTVYGGTIDVVGGVLTVVRARGELNETWSWYKSTSYPGGYYADVRQTLGYKASVPFLCSHAKSTETLSEYVLGTCYCDNSINFRLMTEPSTVQDWKDFIATQRASGTPITICYELATPTTYQLTPTQIHALLGQNNVWADCGDTEVEYKADVQKWVEKMLNA